MNKIVALNKELHKHIKIKQDRSHKQAKNQHISILQVHEFVAASSYYPIVFIKDAETGEFRPVAMLGLQPNENLFFSPGGWSAPYVPTSIKGYPFLIAPETGSVCADMSSDLLNETEGTELFNADGSESTYLKNIKEHLSTFISQSPVTKEFTRFIAEKNFLSPLTLTINTNVTETDGYSLNGLYVMDSKKINEISDDLFLELRHKNYLPAIFAHLASLGTMAGLVQKKSLR
jgi:hypothetical protein